MKQSIEIEDWSVPGGGSDIKGGREGGVQQGLGATIKILLVIIPKPVSLLLMILCTIHELYSSKNI